jgi:hypothetical protein
MEQYFYHDNSEDGESRFQEYAQEDLTFQMK